MQRAAIWSILDGGRSSEIILRSPDVGQGVFICPGKTQVAPATGCSFLTWSSPGKTRTVEMLLRAKAQLGAPTQWTRSGDFGREDGRWANNKLANRRTWFSNTKTWVCITPGRSPYLIYTKPRLGVFLCGDLASAKHDVLQCGSALMSSAPARWAITLWSGETPHSEGPSPPGVLLNTCSSQ